ncbi:hypothetical protein MIMGU_mgv1a008545mg [Erythranthe guttata]|uniref:DFDF domain-containing protein n=1 Tax=Erythranthe guttata TaxID=4155 RepID=A0A022RB27_ERYGU|nr:hypothetical protein MIMGU_mgv1a008545mg [Erythranthe guttata]
MALQQNSTFTVNPLHQLQEPTRLQCLHIILELSREYGVLLSCLLLRHLMSCQHNGRNIVEHWELMLLIPCRIRHRQPWQIEIYLIILTATQTLSFEPPSMSFTGPLSSKSSLPFHQSTLVNSNGLTMPFALTYQNASSIEAQVVNKVVPDPVSSQSVQSSTYFTSSVSDPITEPTEHFLGKMLYPDQKDMGVTSSVAPNFASSAATASQPPLLPLPPPSRKLHDSFQFTEEFDFQAMNEKFNKDEVWGYLGKANQTDEVEGIQQNGTSNHKSWGDNPDRISKTDSKPAYNKDDFFDNISCQTIGHGARNGQNQLPERVKLNSETFGNYQRRPPFGYGEHRGGRGEHRGPHNWGRGYYNYGNRGRGPYLQR